MESNPGFEINHNGLGMIYLEEGMFFEAENEYKKALEIDPGHKNSINNLSIIEKN